MWGTGYGKRDFTNQQGATALHEMLSGLFQDNFLSRIIGKPVYRDLSGIADEDRRSIEQGNREYRAGMALGTNVFIGEVQAAGRDQAMNNLGAAAAAAAYQGAEKAYKAYKKYKFRKALQGARKARKFINKKYTIDMTKAPAGSAVNAAGHARNARWFWKQILEKHPELFSATNKAAIKKGLAPTIDEVWIKANPAHKAFEGDKLIHHHIDQGRVATPLPERVHRKYHGTLHPQR